MKTAKICLLYVTERCSRMWKRVNRVRLLLYVQHYLVLPLLPFHIQAIMTFWLRPSFVTSTFHLFYKFLHAVQQNDCLTPA